MKVKVAKWGNSVAVRIPKSVADDLGLRPGSVVDIERDGTTVAIRAEPKVKIPRYRLEDVVAEMKRLGPDHIPAFEDWSAVEVPWPDEDWSDIAPSDEEMGIGKDQDR